MLAPKDLRTWEVQSRDTRPKHVKNLVFYRDPGNRTFPRWSNSSCSIGIFEFLSGSHCKSAVFCRGGTLITTISVDPALPKALFPSIRCLHKPYFRRTDACKTLFLSTRYLHKPYFCRSGAWLTQFLQIMHMHKQYFLCSDLSVTHISVDPAPSKAKFPSSPCFHKKYEHTV